MTDRDLPLSTNGNDVTPRKAENERFLSFSSVFIDPARHLLPEDVSLAEVLEKQGDADWAVRAAAARALARFGEQAPRHALVTALIDKHPAVRASALHTWAALAPHLPVAPVEACLLDPDWSVRAAAAWALGHFADRAPLSALLALFRDPHESTLVRASALQALAHLKYPSSNVFVGALHDPAWHICETAALELGNLGAQEAVGDLVATLSSDSSPFVRAAAALALANMGPLPHEALAALSTAQYDGDKQVGRAAQWTLGTLFGQASATEREAMIGALAHTSDAIPEDVLYRALSDEVEAVRLAAAHVLGGEEREFFGRLEGTEVVIKDREAERIKERLQQKRGIKKQGDVEFIPLVPSDLVETPPIIAQAFDNQWVPRSLLRLIMDGKLSYRDIAAYIEKLVRTEYIRSLVNGRNIIINRAFIYNNPVVFSDFLEGQPEREAFKALLGSGVIIPFLLREEAPDEPPIFSIHPEGLEAWQKICRDVRMSCVRFAWDDNQAQQEAYDKLARRFHNFAMTAETGNIGRYIQDFGLRMDDAAAFEERLQTLTEATFSIGRGKRSKYVTREELYQKFVTVAGTPPSERLYDSSKQFAAEIKQFLDLAYNVNLADELNGYLLTPDDTLSRTALQEWQMAAHRTSEVTARDLVHIIRQTLFDTLQSGLYLKSMRLLSLQDVLEIRKTDEWETYARNLDMLLKGDLFSFEQVAPLIYRSYATLMVRITAMLEQRHRHSSVTTLTAPWNPVAEFEIDIAGARLSARWTEDGLACTRSGREKPDAPGSGSAPFVARLNIGEWSRSHIRADLFTSFDFMKGRLDAAQEQWAELIAELGRPLKKKEQQEEALKLGPTMNEKESS